MGCYWEHVENLRNVLGTRHEHLENLMGTYWEQGNKSAPTHPFQKPKMKKSSREHSDCLHEISVSKTISHHFQPGLNGHYKSGIFIYLER